MGFLDVMSNWFPNAIKSDRNNTFGDQNTCTSFVNDQDELPRDIIYRSITVYLSIYQLMSIKVHMYISLPVYKSYRQ